MTHEETILALKELGFNGGWVVTGNEITLWENDFPQPTQSELDAGLVLAEQRIAERVATREALLARLGITEEEAQLLLGGQ